MGCETEMPEVLSHHGASRSGERQESAPSLQADRVREREGADREHRRLRKEHHQVDRLMNEVGAVLADARTDAVSLHGGKPSCELEGAILDVLEEPRPVPFHAALVRHASTGGFPDAKARRG